MKNVTLEYASRIRIKAAQVMLGSDPLAVVDDAFYAADQADDHVAAAFWLRVGSAVEYHLAVNASLAVSDEEAI